MTWTESTFDTGEVRLHVLEGPASGPPLVFLHGAVASTRAWLPTASRLAQRWHVYLLDLRGHNLSTWAAGPEGYRLSHFTADVAAFLRERVGEQAVLVGHSLGGVVALLTGGDPVGAQYVRAVVAEDPPLGIFRENGEAELQPALQFFGMVAAMKAQAHTWDQMHAQVVKTMQLPPEPTEAVASEFFRLDPALPPMFMQWGAMNAGTDLSAALGSIACPVLLLQADHSVFAALQDEDVALVRSLVKQVQLVQFPGASHGIHDDQPEQVLAAIEDFLT